MKTTKEIGDIGEEFVAAKLRLAGFEVRHLGGTTPDIDLVVSRENCSMIGIQVKTWTKAAYDSKIVSAKRARNADYYVLIRADDTDNLKPYVYSSDEISQAQPIGMTSPSFPFTKDPGSRNPNKVGIWARKNWLFCNDDRLEDWDRITTENADSSAT